MIRALQAADTIEAQVLLRARPLHNVFLDHVVSAGVLGRVPGFFGFERNGRLGALMMIGPLGGTCLEVVDPDAYEALAEAAAAAAVRPRHIVGDEDVTTPFWCAYKPLAPEAVWTRREPVYVLGASRLVRPPREAEIERARESDLDELVENSAAQHREDLHDDRHLLDPVGFRERHAKDIRDGRWWVTRIDDRIAFQVHVGAENGTAIQLGGVMTPADLRNRGHASRGVAAICERLLERRTAITLFCDERNAAARRVYERVGFATEFYYRSWLLREPVCASNSSGYL